MKALGGLLFWVLIILMLMGMFSLIANIFVEAM
jgi:hypothetical protein